MFCAKNIERMGDHATNIAETVHYMIEGRADRRRAPEGRHHAAFAPCRREVTQETERDERHAS